MRPLRLSLEAFGLPISKRLNGFHPFGENALFLITGPTGGGKPLCWMPCALHSTAAPQGAQRFCRHALRQRWRTFPPP